MTTRPAKLDNAPHWVARAMAPKPAERKAKDRASVALPCLAIGWPSKVVATEDGSPGMLNRIEVVEPPKSAPQ